MTNPDNTVGTNSAYGSRTSVNAFNDIAQLASGRGVLSGWSVSPKSGLTLNVGGVAGIRDVAIAEDNLGNRTTINNRLSNPIEVVIATPSTSSKRVDAIVVYVKNPAQAEDTTQDAPSVCGILAVKGGTNGVSEEQIRSAISADGGGGSTAYYAVLATVDVASGATTITGANIKPVHVSISASDIADGEITTRMIANSAITTDKVASAGITSAKLGAFETVPATDYINITVGTVNSLTALKFGKLVVVSLDISNCAPVAGEKVIGSCTAKVKQTFYGSARITGGSRMGSASYVAIPSGQFRIYGDIAGTGTAGTIWLVEA